MAVSDKLVNLNDLKSVYESQKKDLSYVQNALTLKPHSTNWLDMTQVQDGTEITSSGETAERSNYAVTDYIPVKKGDTIYLTGIKSGNLIPVNNTAIVRLVTYTADKAKIVKSPYPTYTNSYEIPDDGAAYCRFSYSTASGAPTGNATKLAVMINTPPASVDDIKDYYDMSYEAVDATARSVVDAVGTAVQEMQSEMETAQDAVKTYPASTNLLNPAEIEWNHEINQSTGAVVEYSGTTARHTSGKIPAQSGDTIYFTGIQNTGSMMSATTLLRLAWYTGDDTFISQQTYPAQGFAIPTPSSGTVSYIRATWAAGSAVNACSYLTIMKTEPKVPADILPYYRSGAVGVRAVRPDWTVASWGDSLIRNGYNETASADTSVGKQLADLLGTSAENYGVPGMGSGEVALRMNAIDLHVTLENNQIVSGDNNITVAMTSRGTVAQNVMQCGSTVSGGVHCTIGGVAGTYWNYNGSAPKFTPDDEQTLPVSVMPMTKVIPDPVNYYPVTVIWVGKNDFVHFSAAGLAMNLADSACAMAEHVPHNRFVILGVTASSSDDYKTGGTARATMDRYNGIMAKRYPDNFIDIHTGLAEHGLELAGITATAEDTEAIGYGLLPPSIMSDATHMNADGRSAVAKLIYQHMKDKGWV